MKEIIKFVSEEYYNSELHGNENEVETTFGKFKRTYYYKHSEKIDKDGTIYILVNYFSVYVEMQYVVWVHMDDNELLNMLSIAINDEGEE